MKGKTMWSRKITKILNSGYTQIKLAACLGLTQGYISQIKNGKVNGSVSARVAKKIDRLHQRVLAQESK